MRRYLAGVVGLLLLGGSARGQKTPTIVCSLDQPLISSHGTVTATALIDAPNRDTISYAWSATGGTFEQPVVSSTVHWNPPNIGKSLGNSTYTLRVSVHTGDQVIGGCSLEIVVAESERSAPQSPVKASEGAILVPDGSERPGYGLYSYIVIVGEPEGEALERVQALLQSYLDKIFVYRELEGAFKSTQLNVTYLFLKNADDTKPTVNSILGHYDYARAKLILSRVPGQHNFGPYIVSSLHPITTDLNSNDHCLIEDLSTVPASVVPFWVDQFLSQTSQEHFWETNTLSELALRIRTEIAIAAKGLPDVRKAVEATGIVLGSGR